MSYREKVEAQVAVYFQIQPAARKFDSEVNRNLVADRVASWGFVPCEVGVMRALDELIAEGLVYRVDGGSESSDAAAATAREQARIDAIKSAPSTSEEYEKFARMSEAEVEQRFWSDPIFQARYTKASEVWRFKLPGKPPVVASPEDLGRWKNFDERAYRQMPARQTAQLFMTDPFFKKAVNKLIAEGRI